MDGATMETVTDFILGSCKITVDSDFRYAACSLRKSMIKLDSILKSGDLTLLTRSVSKMFFPIVMYGCESWTIKEAEHQRIDAFNMRCWRRLLRFPWKARWSKSVNPKGNQLWMFIGRTDTGKDSDTRKDLRHEENVMTKDVMIRWHH